MVMLEVYMGSKDLVLEVLALTFYLYCLACHLLLKH